MNSSDLKMFALMVAAVIGGAFLMREFSRLGGGKVFGRAPNGKLIHSGSHTPVTTTNTTTGAAQTVLVPNS